MMVLLFSAFLLLKLEGPFGGLGKLVAIEELLARS